jgi:hypothetical protein
MSVRGRASPALRESACDASPLSHRASPKRCSSTRALNASRYSETPAVGHRSEQVRELFLGQAGFADEGRSVPLASSRWLGTVSRRPAGWRKIIWLPV